MKKIRGTFLSIPVLLLANAPALWKLKFSAQNAYHHTFGTIHLGFHVQITWMQRFSRKNPTA